MKFFAPVPFPDERASRSIGLDAETILVEEAVMQILAASIEEWARAKASPACQG
jgi:hypothetical protein